MAARDAFVLTPPQEKTTGAKPEDRRSLVVVVALAAIVAGALFLRLWALPSQGFMFWDEGQYGMEAQFLTDTWQRLLGIHPDPSSRPGAARPY